MVDSLSFAGHTRRSLTTEKPGVSLFGSRSLLCRVLFALKWVDGQTSSCASGPRSRLERVLEAKLLIDSFGIIAVWKEGEAGENHSSVGVNIQSVPVERQFPATELFTVRTLSFIGVSNS